NGPENYGFRGNAQNLDLNRDFIKCDSKNARTFTKVFHEWQPDVFIDTHTSNGADHQYVMTYIATQHNKLNQNIGKFLQKTMIPLLDREMKKKKQEMTPYVYPVKEIPDSGIMEFMDSPRYSTGYTALFNTIGFITETHMLKEFKLRVEATYEFLLSTTKLVNDNHFIIGELKSKAQKETAAQIKFNFNWKLDTSSYENIEFKGFEAKYDTNSVTGNKRLFYDQKSKYDKQIKFYNHYKPEINIRKPYAYLVPQAWRRVVESLELNQVAMTRMNKDTILSVEVYYIDTFKTLKNPFEGHYLHSNTSIKKDTQEIQYYKGDYVILMNQTRNKYIVETLEPQSDDSFFSWNFFDNILQQKEYFSHYVFENKAINILEENAELKNVYEKKIKSDTTFANNPRAKLEFIYKNSQYYERSHMRYPIGRVFFEQHLPVEE
ncbi:hypothetical protein JYT36_00005, partial [Bacteroidales bacterium AH-315-N07]|nr:hypothetical protein [Bacteroidales bacterium AH-315-N07]